MLHKTCKICKDEKPYNRLDVHVSKLHNMSMEEYELYDPEAMELLEFVPKDPISHVDRMDNIFSGKVKASNVDKPLKDFLTKYNVNEKELIAIVESYTKGKPIPLEQGQKLNEKKGIAEAKLKKHLNSVRTPNIHMAEALKKYYGFKCVAVHSAKGSIPQIWELEKQIET